MTGDGNRRQRGRLVYGRIHRDDALDSTLRQQLRVSSQQHGIVPVHHGQEEIVALPQVLLNAADDGRAVGVADLFCDHSDGVGALVAQRARKEIGPVVQFFGGGVDSVLGLLRNGSSRRRIVEHCGNRAGSQSHMLGDGFEGDDLWFLASLLDLRHDRLNRFNR